MSSSLWGWRSRKEWRRCRCCCCFHSHSRCRRTLSLCSSASQSNTKQSENKSKSPQLTFNSTNTQHNRTGHPSSYREIDNQAAKHALFHNYHDYFKMTRNFFRHPTSIPANKPIAPVAGFFRLLTERSTLRYR